jgi:hypothetical protein
MRLFVIVLIIGLEGSAQVQTRQVQALTSVRSLKCTFPRVAQANWRDDSPKPIVKNQDFGFEIRAIDSSKGTAVIGGELGTANVPVIKGIDTLTVIERTVLGMVNVTSVFAAQDKAGRFKAVHSRHLGGGKSPFPSQSYGYCIPTR